MPPHLPALLVTWYDEMAHDRLARWSVVGGSGYSLYGAVEAAQAGDWWVSFGRFVLALLVSVLVPAARAWISTGSKTRTVEAAERAAAEMAGRLAAELLAKIEAKHGIGSTPPPPANPYPNDTIRFVPHPDGGYPQVNFELRKFDPEPKPPAA